MSRGRRRGWREPTLALLLAAAAMPLAGQEAPGRPLTLEAAVGRAVASHPSVAAARAAVEGARGAVAEARSARLPGVTSQLGATRFEEPMVVAPLHGFDPQSPPRFDRTLVQGGVSVGYTLYDGGAGSARVRRASALEEAAGAGLDGARQALIAETSHAYLGVATARQVLASAAARLRAVRAEAGRADRLFEQGRVARVAVLRAAAAASLAQADSVASAWDVDVAVRSLARLMGAEPTAVAAAVLAGVPATAAAPAAAREPLLDAALAASPAVAQARERLAAAAAARDVAGSAWRPRVELVGRLAEYASGAGHEQAEWQGGVQLSWPVFTGGARPAEVARATASERAAAAELRLAELRVAEAVDRGLAAHASAAGRAAALAAAVAQSEEVARIERLALEQGAGLQTDYLAAEADLFRARAQLAQARAAAVAARIELARAAGVLDETWIAENLGAEP